jgi:ABC-type amino acid transport substrate-binding protein
MRVLVLTALLAASVATQAAEKPVLRYLEKVDGMLGAVVPPTEFQDKLGAALARQLGRRVEYLKLPRNRIMAALENGEGDILCSYLPEWLPGEVDWTRAFIPISEVVVTAPRVKPPTTVADLRGKRIGTVLGFRYPELEKTLGQDYIRDDAPSSALSVRKWLAGRFDYLVVPRTVLDKQASTGKLPAGYHVMTVYEVKTKCAVSRKSSISAADFNNAIEALDKAGELPKILKLR